MKGHFHSGHGHGEESHGEVIHWAGFYHFAFGRFIRRTHPAVVELAAPRPGERLLDVGCGTGSLALALKAAVGPSGSVQGIDASPEMIEVARRAASRAGADVEFRIGLGQAIPFPDGTFDLVVSQLAIHHLPADQMQTAFGEMRRVLKPAGRCLVIDFEPPRAGLRRLIARMMLASIMMQVDVREYRPLMEKAGFVEVESGPTRHRLLSFIRGRAGTAQGGRA